MRLLSLLSATLLLSSTAFAAPDLQITGEIKQTLPVPEASPTTHHTSTLKQSTPKSITLLKVKLSDNAKKTLAERGLEASQSPVHHMLNGPISREPVRPSNVQLGMNALPVFDQGQHGACAMFANIAAIDAALQIGDYISPLCQLQLGRHIENLGYTPSGWDGSIGPLVLSQIITFGIINKTEQQRVGCGGLTEYPVNQNLPETDMSLQDFHAMSEPLSNDVAWTSLLDPFQVFMDKTNPQKTLDAVKDALIHHDRLTMGVLLPNLSQGVAGAVGRHHTANDSWILTPELIETLTKQQDELAGHETLITGYDDFASATDKHGQIHRGLLTLRNSWGDKVGDQGNFYMSYDFFKILTIEIQRIRALNDFAV